MNKNDLFVVIKKKIKVMDTEHCANDCPQLRNWYGPRCNVTNKFPHGYKLEKDDEHLILRCTYCKNNDCYKG